MPLIEHWRAAELLLLALNPTPAHICNLRCTHCCGMCVLVELWCPVHEQVSSGNQGSSVKACPGLVALGLSQNRVFL